PPAPKPDAYEAGQSLTNKGEDDFVNAWNKMGYGYFPGPQPTTSARLANGGSIPSSEGSRPMIRRRSSY
ncbi:MAG: hypothetical protein ACRC1K_20195, partial [Planctomycetia bacterium]